MYIPAYPKKKIKNNKIDNTDVPNSYFFRSASHALYFYLKEIQHNTNNTIYIPAFICNSVTEVAIQAGFNITFYDLNRDLTPKIEKILFKKGDVIILVNYFGLNLNLASKWNYHFNNKVHLIIDNAHLMLTVDDLNISNSSATIFSLWKTVPLTEGGLLIHSRQQNISNKKISSLNTNLVRVVLQKIQLFCFTVNFNLLWFKDYILNFIKLNNKKFKYKNKYSQLNFKKPKLLSTYNFNLAKIARLNNYEYLVKKLKNTKGVKIMFEKMPNGTIPLTLPISVNNANQVYKKIRKHGVECFMWPFNDTPKKLNLKYFTVANYWNKNVIHLPVQQDLKRKHLDKIIYAVIESIKS